MPLQNPMRTSTYTSSTSASTTPTQSVYSSLYMTTSKEQKELGFQDLNRLSLSFSTSSDEASMVPSKAETDSSRGSMMLPIHAAPAPTLPERGRGRQGKPITVDYTRTVTPPQSSASQDPHFQYLSSSESASSPGGSSIASRQSDASSRSPSPADSFLFMGVSRAIPVPNLASNKTDEILGESTPAIAKPMNIVRYGKPRVISISSSGRSSTCTSRSRGSLSSIAEQPMRTTFIESVSSQSQPSRSESSQSQNQPVKISETQHFARKHARKASDAMQYPELRPLASLGESRPSSSRAQANRARAAALARSRTAQQQAQQQAQQEAQQAAQQAQLRNLYPTTLPAISSLSAQQQHPQRPSHNRRYSFTLSPPAPQPVFQPTPSPHHYDPALASSSWAKKIGLSRSPVVPKGQRSRGAGIRPPRPGDTQRSASVVPWDESTSTNQIEVIESVERDVLDIRGPESRASSRMGSSTQRKGPSSIGLVRRASVFGGGSSSSGSESNFGW